MSNDIGYGAAAIRSGDVKYQASLVDLLKQAGDNKPEKHTVPEAKPAEGHTVDIKA